MGILTNNASMLSSGVVNYIFNAECFDTPLPFDITDLIGNKLHGRSDPPSIMQVDRLLIFILEIFIHRVLSRRPQDVSLVRYIEKKLNVLLKRKKMPSV